MKNNYPKIQTIHDSDYGAAQIPFYVAEIERIIQHVLPPNFFIGENMRQKLEQQLPLVCWTPIQEPPFEMTFFLCAYQRTNAFHFFYDMITRWLIPGKKLYAPLQFSADFKMPSLSSQPFVAGELSIKIESVIDLEQLQRNLPIIEREIRLGVTSSYQASRILEIKGFSSDTKTALIQENLVTLIKRRPHHFDYDILNEMQHFLVLCQDEFKNKRNYRHISRIIAVNYLFRKALLLSDEAYLDKRLLNIKLLRQKIESGKAILGVIVAISFLHENERLEGRHLARAMRKIIKNISLVESSFLCSKHRSDKASILYIEVEKKDRRTFSHEEMLLLQEGLEDEIKAHIEESVNPIFMPENEEIVMRNMLILSDQLTFVRDIPQVILTYKEQRGQKLEFLVVLVRVVKTTTIPITRFFELVQSPLDFFFDRNKKIGVLRKKYVKEANVFRVQIEKSPYLRQDGSIDLYKARECVMEELRHILGDFRDYHGGYMSKERELFLNIIQELGPIADKHAFLLENYFYSIHPVARRAGLPLESLKKLFLMLLKITKDGLKGGESYSFHAKEFHGFCNILIVGANPTFKTSVLDGINHLKLNKDHWAYFFMKDGDNSYLGFILEKMNSEEVVKIRFVIEKCLEEWGNRERVVLSIGIKSD